MPCIPILMWLVQERRNSSGLAMEFCLSCTNPSIWCLHCETKRTITGMFLLSWDWSYLHLNWYFYLRKHRLSTTKMIYFMFFIFVIFVNMWKILSSIYDACDNLTSIAGHIIHIFPLCWCDKNWCPWATPIKGSLISGVELHVTLGAASGPWCLW